MPKRKMLVFVCNGCSYGGADQAGERNLEYPSGVRLVKVMCSGRVDPQMVLESFGSGADGVMILGCHPGDCQYKQGNRSAFRRAALLAPMLQQYGIEVERFRIDWVSANEGERFSKLVNEMYEILSSLDPLKLLENSVVSEGNPREMHKEATHV